MSNQEKIQQVKESVETSAIEWPTTTVEVNDDSDCLVFTLHDHGDLNVTLTCTDDEWLAMCQVAPVSAVADPVNLNDTLLRMGMMLPLVSVGIARLGDEDAYVIYGQSFADCKHEALAADITACADAAIEVADLIANQ